MSTSPTRTRTTAAARRAGLALTAGALGAALLAGCGTAGASGGAPAAGDNPLAPTASALPDPCTLLRDDQASEMLHDTVKRKGPEHPDHGVTCKWDSSEGFLSVAVYPKQFFPTQRPAGARPMSGLGSSAYITKEDSGAIVGDTAVFVQAFGHDAELALDSTMRIVVRHVPR